MKRMLLLVTVLAFLAMFAVSGFAAKGGIPGAPTTTGPTTTTTTVGYWTCEARYANGGTGWVLGSWDDSEAHYFGPDVPSCVDILSDHLDTTHWRVEWSGTTARGTVKGLKLVFEEEVHGNVCAETVVTSETGVWEVSWDVAEIGNLVFVAMPHSGDKWVGPVTFVVTPLN